MTRKTKETVITAENRDKGKVFILTEPSSAASEKIALQFFFTLARAGAKIPKEIRNAGMAGIATLFDSSSGFEMTELLAYLNYEDIDPLLSQLMGCINYRHAPQHPVQQIKEGDECQIDEISTRIQLKMEVFELITGFSIAG